MPRLTKAVPKYRHHKATGQAVVTIQGRDHYLGPWRSKASKLEYDRLVGEWLASGRPATAAPVPGDITVAESIVGKLGMQMRDLFKGQPRIIAEYNYHDENGNVIFQVVHDLPPIVVPA